MLSTVRVMPRRIAVVTALLMLALAWVVGSSNLTRAAAAEIDGAITGVNISQTSAGPAQAMKLNLTWAVPDSASGGDTFTLTLPPELNAVTNGFNLLAPDGSVVAVAKVVGRVVTFTLTNYANTHNDVKGDAFFSVRWDASNTPTEGPYQLDFTTSTKVFHDTVIKTAGSGTPDRTKPRKVGHWVDPNVTTGNDALGWTVDSPSGPFNKATFVDNPGAGQAIDCSTVVRQLGKGLDATGHASSFQALPASKIISSSCSASGLTLVAGPILADQIIRIKYLVNITDDTLTTYTNSVNVTVDGTQYGNIVDSIKVQAAGGSGSGTSSSSGSATSTSTTSSSSTSGTSTGGATVLPTKLTASVSGAAAGLAVTGSRVLPMLTLAGLLLGSGLLLAVGGRMPRGSRKH
jgi:Bacterial Ig domain